jgi:subtilisin family serine protease
MAGFAIVAGAVSVPGATLAARPVAPADTWIVSVREPEGGTLPTRRGGLRSGASAIARDRAAATSRTIDALERSVGFTASFRYTYAMPGFAARLNAVEVAALRADRRVVGMRKARPMAPASEIVPAGIERIGATTGPIPASFPDVAVAVVDTGVGKWVNGSAWRHGTELNLVGGFNAFAPPGGNCSTGASTGPASYDDTNGHGTHVAGTIGAADNGVGAVGVAPGVPIFSVRVFQGIEGSDATVICGLDWIASWNAAPGRTETDDIDAVNMSLRGYAPPNPTQEKGCGASPYTSPPSSEPEERAICRVMATGATVVVAAGNETQPVSDYTPSRFRDVLTVAAISDFDGIPGGLGSEPCVPPRGTETDDTFSRYSNFGPEVDIAAPGTCVRSTDLGSAGGTVFMSGTSMATPHVTGAAARYVAVHPNAGAKEVMDHLVGSGTSDWNATTDPDNQPDRLVDVAALVAADADVALQTVPLEVGVPGGTAERTVKVRLQRIGGYDGPATISRVGPLPEGVAAVTFGNDGQIGGGPGPDQRVATITIAADPPDGIEDLILRVDGDGGIQGETTLQLRFDRTVPEIGGAWPRITFRAGTWLNSAPVRLSWTATDSAGSLRSQALKRSRKGGSFQVYSRPRPTATSADVSMERKVVTGWRVEATDLVGNVGTSSDLTTRMVVTQAQAPTVTQSAGWWLIGRSSAAASDLLVTRTAGATLTFPFTGRAITVVAPLGQGLGRFKVRIDGKAAGVVDLGRKQSSARRLVWTSDALTPGPHTIKLVALDGRVELDAFLVLK